MGITYSEDRKKGHEQIAALFTELGWTSGAQGERLHKGLEHSHSLITAWDGERLAGMACAISDGYMVMYVPFVAVHPDYQGRGIGTEIMNRLVDRYREVARKVLVALDGKEDFYERFGFVKSGDRVPMYLKEY
ncbi:GNAT family N-acetyltransferase [Salidesulfovibrio onnuriiensis]|uniref:GNAT family N-acetyltransferase n=1 Tax=Salidesulfovibrio onnuriiensis TaxID=2583823 RepID=UPI00165046B3|nr:GNAT family N-acetyltransferase [Salidesulfovibrio onnuriiensis]